MTKEEKFTKTNMLIINDRWRAIRRDVKSKELKAEITVLKNTFDRVIDQKDEVIKALVLDIEEAEEQYMMALRSHLQNVDQFLGKLWPLFTFFLVATGVFTWSPLIVQQRLMQGFSEKKKLEKILGLALVIRNHIKTFCYVLTFDPAPKNAIPRWCTGRKWHIPMASNQKRSRGRIKAYNMGQGEGPTVLIQTDAPEESDLWTAWQLFPLDDD